MPKISSMRSRPRPTSRSVCSGPRLFSGVRTAKPARAIRPGDADWTSARAYLTAIGDGHLGPHLANVVRSNAISSGGVAVGGTPSAGSNPSEGLVAWPQATDGIKAIMAHFALKSLGAVCGFSVSLGAAAEDLVLARGARYAVQQIRSRVNRFLENALRRPVEVWFWLQVGKCKGARFHLEGEIGCSPAERATVAAALEKIGGAPSATASTNIFKQLWDPFTVLKKIFQRNSSPMVQYKFAQSVHIGQIVKKLYTSVRNYVYVNTTLFAD